MRVHIFVKQPNRDFEADLFDQMDRAGFAESLKERLVGLDFERVVITDDGYVKQYRP